MHWIDNRDVGICEHFNQLTWDSTSTVQSMSSNDYVQGWSGKGHLVSPTHVPSLALHPLIKSIWACTLSPWRAFAHTYSVLHWASLTPFRLFLMAHFMQTLPSFTDAKGLLKGHKQLESSFLPSFYFCVCFQTAWLLPCSALAANVVLWLHSIRNRGSEHLWRCGSRHK